MNLFIKLWHSVQKIIKSIYERIISPESHANEKNGKAKSASQSTSAFDNKALDDKPLKKDGTVDQIKTISIPETQNTSSSQVNEIRSTPSSGSVEDIEKIEPAGHPDEEETKKEIDRNADIEENTSPITLSELLNSTETCEPPTTEDIEDTPSTDDEVQFEENLPSNEDSGVEEEENPKKEVEEIPSSEKEHETENFIDDLEQSKQVKHAEMETEEQLEEDQSFDGSAEEEISINSVQEKQMNQIPDSKKDAENSKIIKPNQQFIPKQKRIQARESSNEKSWSPGKYYREFVLQRNLFQELTDDEVDKFLFKLEQDEIDDIIDWSMLNIENYLFESLKRVHLIGELPISKAAFKRLCKFNQEYRFNRSDARLSKQKNIPPAFFVTMMVFCARYSEEDARNFWTPYAQIVWGHDEADYSFQNVCRDHFRACREDLADSIGMSFLVYRPGDVVLPVYQHAIIPFHLMEHMAEWIVKEFEIFMYFNPSKLENLISNNDELQKLPHQLQRFLTNEETSQSAAALLRKMSDAIAIFKEKKSSKLVETIIDSPIEKSLWNAIYEQLMKDKSHIEQIRTIKSKLDWIWNVNKEELELRLSGVVSPENQRPSMLYIVSDGSFKTASYQSRIDSWRGEDKRWIAEKTIPSEALINNNEVYVISYNFDLDKTPDEQQDCILFTSKVPIFSGNLIFFRHGQNRINASEKKDIQSDGNWIIISKTDFEILNQNRKNLSYSDHALPRFLRKSGFKYVRRYEIELPIILVSDEGETPKEAHEGCKYLDPILEGDRSVPGLSKAIPPVFQTQNVYLSFELDPQYSLRKTYFSISNQFTVISTASFAELKRNGQLVQFDSGIRINLSTFVDKFGNYQIDIIHGLRSLLDEPVHFGYLEEIEILLPETDQTFSPKKPFEVVIRNIDDYLLDYPEDIKFLQDDERKTLKWKLHKSPECSFSINDGHGGHIELLWSIDRVTAWVEGGFNKNLIEVGQEDNSLINVRGKPYQEFHWIINHEIFIPDKLDVRGEISNSLRYLKIRDSLRETKTSLSLVEIDIEDMRWKVFDYLKQPSVIVEEINYEKGTLNYQLMISPKLTGHYQFQIKKKGAMAAPVAVLNLKKLEEQGKWKVELSEGDYILEIHLENELLATSERFSFHKPLRYRRSEEETKSSKNEEKFQKTISLNDITAESIFDLLTAEKTQFASFEQEGFSKIPYFQQLACINDKSYWYIDGKVEDGIKNLLPFWAVTKHPFRFVERKFHKTLIIYPSETAFGGIVGRGYTHLKVNNQKEIVYAAWKPDSDSNYIKLFLCFPKVSIHPKFFDLDKVSSWYLRYLRPAYQCVDCGDLLGTGEEGFPPNIFNQHLHGGQKLAREQFIDTRRQESLDNTLSIFEEELLNFEDKTKNSVVENCFEILEKDPKARKHQKLSKPIVTTNNLDYSKAFTELFENYKKGENKKAIGFFINEKEFFDDLDTFLTTLANKIVPISAMERLFEVLPEDELLCEIPKFSLNLCTLLRLKAHFANVYFSFLESRQIEESQLMMMAYTGMQGFPKLLEWSTAWAEIFFVHAIS